MVIIGDVTLMGRSDAQWIIRITSNIGFCFKGWRLEVSLHDVCVCNISRDECFYWYYLSLFSRQLLIEQVNMCGCNLLLHKL